MEKEEYKIIIRFIDRVLNDLKKDMKHTGTDIDSQAVRGAQNFMSKYMKMWKEIIKEDYSG